MITSMGVWYLRRADIFLNEADIFLKEFGAEPQPKMTFH